MGVNFHENNKNLDMGRNLLFLAQFYVSQGAITPALELLEEQIEAQQKQPGPSYLKMMTLNLYG